MGHIDHIYNVCSRTRFPPPSTQQVADLEARMGNLLPPDYREFVLKYNGGFFHDPDIAPVGDDCPRDALTVLYGFGASDPSAELGSDTYLFSDNDPVTVLPIGYTIMGNLLYILTDPDPDECGSIGLKLAYSEKYFVLADGIEDFFALIRPYSPSR